ncbi:HD-GYP domain-containing protein [Paenibacillus beijingensis]|uniref:Histidine kinase n=1 Tax=Paenibacillus beijingensis TaxID=1126833 RepID=A0A0D5NLD8_9BACL|nr:HD-GYP domain-containing protein [Paenibacillus beijingensis]AJY75965.1 histidine kinase [Paenibacillus beijingensis]
MILMPISMCRPGMRLAKKIFSEDGLVLLGEHVEITKRMIVRLAECGIQFVYIQDSRTADITLPELISDETVRVALGEIRSHFRTMMDQPPRKKGVMYPYVGKQFRDVLNRVIDDLVAVKETVIMMMNIGSVDHYLYQHSLNVCVYTTLLGIASGYSRDELMTLGLGALLHDIGKTQVPAGVLKKPGKLTDSEFEEMKKHTEYGFKLLKDEPGIPLIAAHCAYQHHERLNGSGYPRGLRGNEIHEYAKWIGLVDSYDAMTTSRIYRRPMLPHQAVESLYAGTGTLYEQEMVRLFRDKVAIYPLGMTVRMNTGESGVVVGITPLCPHRPVVRILADSDGIPLKSPYEVDLSTQLNAMIVSTNDVQTAPPLLSIM